MILPQDRAAFWLDRSVEDPAALASILIPYPADKLAVYEVAPLVNSVANDTPAVIAPVASIHRTLADSAVGRSQRQRTGRLSRGTTPATRAWAAYYRHPLHHEAVGIIAPGETYILW